MRVSFEEFWRVIRKKRGLSIYIFLVVSISTVFFSLRQPDIYRAEVTVELGGVKGIGGFFVWGSRGILSVIANEIETIGGPEVEREVVKRLALAPEEDFWYRAEKVERTNLIEISAKNQNPKRAKELVNTVTEVYRDLSLKRREREFGVIREGVEKRLSELKVELPQAEEALREFKQREGNIPLAKKTLKEKLVELETNYARLIYTYPKDDPIIKGKSEQIREIKEELKSLAAKEAELNRLEREVKFNQREYEDYQKRLAGLEITKEHKVPDVKIISLAQEPRIPIGPNRPMTIAVGLVIGLMLAFSFPFLLQQLDTSLGTIEAVEKFIELAVLGVIPYLGTQRKKFSLNIIRGRGVGRYDKIAEMRERLIINYSTQSPVCESYRVLRTNIQASGEKNRIRTLAITSATTGEGKSITTTNLAIASALAGRRVLLVSADLRRPVIHRLFGLRREPGLADILVGRVGWRETVRTITDILMATTKWERILDTPGLDNLNIITSGFPLSDPAIALDSPEMVDLIEELKVNFDIVLFDSPPVLSVTDVSLLAPQLDSVIVVYRVGKVAREVLRRAKIELEGTGVNIKGVVLNNTTVMRELGVTYPYYRYRYYGEEKNKKGGR